MKIHWKVLPILFVAFLTILWAGNVRAAETATIDTEVIIVGGGGSGLAAALTAATGGAKVTVLEKRKNPGGTSNFPEGVYAVESEMQRKLNIGITRDEGFRIIMDYSHWRANARLARAFVDKSASTIEWLRQLGVEFEYPAAIFPNGYQTWHLLKGRGAAMVKVLVAKCKEKGVDLQLGLTVKKILKDSNGRVTGVMAEKENGALLQVNGRVVVISTGGYANNAEMIKKYTGLEVGKNVFPVGNTGKMGEGIKMAWEAGAAEEGMGVLQFVAPDLPGPGLQPFSQIAATVSQPTLWINQRGERFCDEAIGHNWPLAGNAAVREPGHFVYSIFDEKYMTKLMVEGIDKARGVYVPPGTKMEKIHDQIKFALDKGNPNIFIADSIPALAKKVGIDSNVLKATIDEYNGFCAKGHDDLFAKNREYLRPIKEGKFYAFRIYPFYLGTIGGVRINEKTEAVNAMDIPIQGLYVVGNDAAGMYGDSYDLLSAGGTLGFAVNSGRIAGENALKYLGK